MPSRVWSINNVSTGQDGSAFTMPLSAVAGSVLRYGKHIVGTVPVLPVISGAASPIPGNVLTSTIARQWFRDNAAITGETGLTYTVLSSDVGSVIGQRVPSQDRTVQGTPTFPGLNLLLSADIGLLDGDGNPCAHGAAVANWQDQSGLGNHAIQTTAGFRPTARIAEIAGHNTVQFDGVSQFLSLVSGALGSFRNKGYGYLVAVIRDTDRSAGFSSHPVYTAATPLGGTSYRMALETRGGGDNFRARGKTLDADGVTSSSIVSRDGFVVLTIVIDWMTGKVQLRINGSSSAILPGSLTNAGLTSDTDSASIWIGKGNTSCFPGHIAWLLTAAPPAPWTTEQLAFAEQTAAAHAGIIL